MGAARTEDAMGEQRSLSWWPLRECWWPLGRCMTRAGGTSGGSAGARAEQLQLKSVSSCRGRLW